MPGDFLIGDMIVAGRSALALEASESGGGEKSTPATVTNMSLLQPSRLWPGDHFAVVCAVDVQLSTYVAKQRRSVAAALYEAVLAAVGVG